MSKTKDKVFYVITELINGRWGGVFPVAHNNLEDAKREIELASKIAHKFKFKIDRVIVLGDRPSEAASDEQSK